MSKNKCTNKTCTYVPRKYLHLRSTNRMPFAKLRPKIGEMKMAKIKAIEHFPRIRFKMASKSRDFTIFRIVPKFTYHAQIATKLCLHFLLKIPHVQKIRSGFWHFVDFLPLRFPTNGKNSRKSKWKRKMKLVCVQTGKCVALAKNHVVSLQVSNIDCALATTAFGFVGAQ